MTGTETWSASLSGERFHYFRDPAVQLTTTVTGADSLSFTTVDTPNRWPLPRTAYGKGWTQISVVRMGELRDDAGFALEALARVGAGRLCT